MNPRIIKTEEQYEEALGRIEYLMDSPEGDTLQDELELLVLLVEKYEKENYPMELPDPVDAIRFRMEQAGLSNKDLIRYIGSQSKVSEVLNRKRPLSLSMMRALHEGLGIPAEVLLQQPGEKMSDRKYAVSDFPFTEMFKRGYFSPEYSSLSSAKDHSEECLEQFFTHFEDRKLQVFYRRTDTKFGSQHYLRAWQARIINVLEERMLPTYMKEKLDRGFFQELAHLSLYKNSVLLVEELLHHIGIHFVIEKHLPKTYLDGACFFTPQGNPVVAMTLRFDRQDNFWFTLLHELSHIYLGHITPESKDVIIDDTSRQEEADGQEREANHFTYQLIIPDEVWEKRRNELLGNGKSIINFSEEMKISPALIAGRLRWEENNYKLYPELVGNGEVRKYFLQTAGC